MTAIFILQFKILFVTFTESNSGTNFFSALLLEKNEDLTHTMMRKIRTLSNFILFGDEDSSICGKHVKEFKYS